VLHTAITEAAGLSGSVVALTFDPHPSKVLRPGSAPRLLTSTPHKLRLMEDLGLEFVLVVTFDDAFSQIAAADFVANIVTAANPLRVVCVGEGWKFGHHRLGDGALLRRLGESSSFRTIEVPPVQVDGHIVSSTRIRRAVESGDLQTARALLGRPYSVLGTVVRGNGIGRRIGFPTANLAAHNEQFPPDGVYAVRVRVGNRILPGVANIGTRPTVDPSGHRLLEVHLLDHEADLYGSDIEATFVKFLRGEKKLPDVAALAGQIAIDVASARELLNNPSAASSP
jgi:riboflavin kinase/FMN adenylyltransferase